MPFVMAKAPLLLKGDDVTSQSTRTATIYPPSPLAYGLGLSSRGDVLTVAGRREGVRQHLVHLLALVGLVPGPAEHFRARVAVGGPFDRGEGGMAFSRASSNIARYSPNRFIRSSTFSAVGSYISSTILPLARKTMRSA